jgi:hypothetical protein
MGVTLAQQAVDNQTDDGGVADATPDGPPGRGRRSDYVMGVQANQPQLREDIATVFALPPIATETRTVMQTVDGGHGRIEQRWLETSDVLVGYSDWPGLAQVVQRERQVVSKKTGEVCATAIGLMRRAGYTNIAATCRRFAAQPALALVLIGIQLEN